MKGTQTTRYNLEVSQKELEYIADICGERSTNRDRGTELGEEGALELFHQLQRLLAGADA